MRLVSVNVGLPREVAWKGSSVSTGIFKEPIQGRVMLRRLNLDGDRQAGLSVHGGADKAVYAYPAEHYHYWRGELPPHGDAVWPVWPVWPVWNVRRELCDGGACRIVEQS